MSVNISGSTYTVFQPTRPQDPQTVVTSTTVLITPAAPTCCAPGTLSSITFQGYWNDAHPPSSQVPGNTGNGNAPSGCDLITDTNNLNTISRDSVLNYELLHNYQNDKSVGPSRNGTNGEVGGPTCSSPDTSLPVDRRYVNVAVVNCRWLQDNAGYSLNGHQDNLPVAAIGQFLLSNSVDAAADPIYGVLTNYCTFTQVDPSIPLCSAGGVSGGVTPPPPRIRAVSVNDPVAGWLKLPKRIAALCGG